MMSSPRRNRNHRHIDIPSPDEMRDLIRRAQSARTHLYAGLAAMAAGDAVGWMDAARSLADSMDARDRAIVGNMPLVYRFARSYYVVADPDDLNQHGAIGLIMAVDHFNLSRPCKFSTYARFWIRQQIIQYLRSRRLVHVPSDQSDHLRRQARRSAVDPKYADKVRVARSRRDSAILPPASLDAAADATGRKIGSEIPCPASIRAIEDNRTESLCESVEIALKSLTDRERFILDGRFRDSPERLEDLARKAGMSREWARRLEKSALAKLKKTLA